MKKAGFQMLVAAVITLPLSTFAQVNVAIEVATGVIASPLIATQSCVIQAVGTNVPLSGRAAYDITISQPGGHVIVATVSSPEHASSLAINIDADVHFRISQHPRNETSTLD